MEKHKLSIFSSVKAKTSRNELLIDIINEIKSPSWQITIEEIRDKKAIGDKNLADELKKSLPAFSPSGIFDGDHKASSILEYSGILHLDIDKQDEKNIRELEESLKKDIQVLAFFRSPSGNGLKIFYWHKGLAINHSENLKKLMALFYRKYKIMADEAVSDLGRLCYFSHDPNAYYNENAEPLDLQNDYKKLDGTLIATMKETGFSFKVGQRNHLIFSFAIRCNKSNFSKEETLSYLLDYFVKDDFKSSEISDTVNSAFNKNYNEKKTNTFNITMFAQIEEAFSMLGYRFKYNIVKNNIDCWLDNHWVDLTDLIFNDIIKAVNNIGVKAKENDIKIILYSSSTLKYDPFKNYLDNLSPWDGYDYIGDLWDTLNIDDEYKKYFIRWIVLLVASMNDSSKSNPYVLTLIGPQGVGKTRWLNKLIPEKLSNYRFQGILDLRDKDSKITLAENLLINLDELDAIDRNEVARLKELITSSGYKVRPPYGKIQEFRCRRASFCASLNNMNFLMDKTGSRRFLIIDVNNPINHNHNINMDYVFAQAFVLYKESESLYLSDSEMAELKERNESYGVYSMEDELINEFIRKPLLDEPYQSMSATEIATFLKSRNDSFRPNQRTNSVIGTILTTKGFEKYKSGGNKKYKVVLI
jgi:GTPase SAR1 family protein